MRQQRTVRRGISLLETVLAASLLGGAVMTVCGLAAGSLRSVRLNQEYEKAWDYIERQLTLIDLTGVDALQKSGKTGGQFESLDGRVWHWNVQIAETEITSLYDVVVAVEWVETGRPRRVQCRTRMMSRSSTVDEAESTDQTAETTAPATAAPSTQGTAR